MTGSIALDVVIGLVFIYLLYSLFATVIMEIINTFCGLRARNLRYALLRILKDEKDTKWYLERVLYKVVNFFIKPIGFSINLINDGMFKAFYNRPSIKYLSAGGTANQPSYISPQNFSKTLLDVIQYSDEETNINNSDSLIEKIRRGISKLPDDSDTKAHLESLLVDAQYDLEKFKKLLELWFEDTMERAVGWFKRRVQFVLFVLGFVLAVSFNADTLAIIKKLSIDPEGRAQLVELATQYTKDNETLIEEINRLQSDAKNSSDSLKIDQATQLVTANMDSLQNLSAGLKSDIQSAQSVINIGWELPEGKDKLTFWDKLCFAISPQHIWGYLLTAIAISMGSPFWFDLLNRLIQLRNSVKTKNNEQQGPHSSGTTSTNAVSTINRVG